MGSPWRPPSDASPLRAVQQSDARQRPVIGRTERTTRGTSGRYASAQRHERMLSEAVDPWTWLVNCRLLVFISVWRLEGRPGARAAVPGPTAYRLRA